MRPGAVEMVVCGKQTPIRWIQPIQRTLVQEEAGTGPCNAVHSSVGEAALLLAEHVSDALSSRTA